MRRQRNCAAAGNTPVTTEGVKFSVDALLANASAATGLDDFGDDEFREGLARYVEGTNQMPLSAMGAAAFQGEVQRLLVNRLHFAKDLKRHPEILDQDLSDPIIIMGMPRTGTTKLQRMVAADPGFQSLKFWQMMNPSRFPDAVAGKEDPRIEAGRQMLGMMAQMTPGLMQSHPTQVNDADEEIFLQLLTFKSIANYMSHPAPGYREWVTQQPMRGTYRYLKQLLQYLQWQDGGRRGRPWVLKTPVHMGNLDLLLELFPTATYVFTHRKLHDAIPSFCRLMEMFWRLKMDNVDMNYLGRFVVDVWATEMRKHLRLREQLGSRISIFDVQYAQIKNAPIDTLREIYRRAGRTFTPQREQAIREWEVQDIYGSFGSYSYTLEQYGLTREVIDAAFTEYNRRFAP
jgi:Sulfotransferase family